MSHRDDAITLPTVNRRDEAGSGSRAWPPVAILAYAGFLVILALVAAKVVIPFDKPVLDFASGFSSLTAFWDGVSNSANYPLIVIGVGIIVWLLVKRRFREAILVALVLAAATAGSEGVKELIHRPRPTGTDPRVIGVVYSFPSGHTLEAATIYGIIALKVWRSKAPSGVRALVVLAAVLMVALVGFARMALQAHFPSDVLAGLLVGIGDIAVYAWFTRPGSAADQSGRGSRA